MTGMTDEQEDTGWRWKTSMGKGKAVTIPFRGNLSELPLERQVGFAMLGLTLAAAILWGAVTTGEGRSLSGVLRDARENTAAIDTFGVDLDKARSEVETPVADRAGEGTQQLASLPSSHALSLSREFERIGYDLAAIRAQRQKVPRVLATSVPEGLADFRQVERKKTIFFKMVLPLVLTTNERLLNERKRVMALREELDQGKALAAADRAWLDRMYKSYKVENGDIDTLVRRIDIVPPSLALAQAAIESGWGTSRFARKGNALFGQWVWGDEANGIVPEDRQAGKTHKIRAFDTPLGAVAAYIKNLNTHRAYRKFRSIRATLRRQGAGINGLTLAAGLEAYSEKGMEYVRLVRGIIDANKLRPFDKARLADRPPKNIG